MVGLTERKEDSSGNRRNLVMVSTTPVEAIAQLTVPATTSQSSQPGLR